MTPWRGSVLALLAALASACNALWGVDALDYTGTTGSTTSSTGAGGTGGAGNVGGGGSSTGGGGPGGGGAGGAAPCVLGPFDPPTNVAELNTAQTDSHPWLTADGLALYFASNRPLAAAATELWLATRPSPAATFDAPQKLTTVGGSDGSDVRPSASADGLELYFASTRTGGLGGADLWLAVRQSPQLSFGPPTNLAALSSINDDYDPGISPDGLTLFFTSNRGGSGLGNEIWAATRPSVQVAFAGPAAVAGVSSTGSEAQPWISADGLRLYFGSNRTGSVGLHDIWMASRASPQAGFDAPQPMAELNTAYEDWGPSLSLDERTIFFYSTRPGGSGGEDLWQAKRDCLP